jgi:hypothetical protein
MSVRPSKRGMVTKTLLLLTLAVVIGNLNSARGLSYHGSPMPSAGETRTPDEAGKGITSPWQNRITSLTANGWIVFATVMTIMCFLFFWRLHKWIDSLQKQTTSVQAQISALNTDTNEIAGGVKRANDALQEGIRHLEESINTRAREQHTFHLELRDHFRDASKQGPMSTQTKTPDSDSNKNSPFPSSVAGYLKDLKHDNLTTTEAKSDVLRGGNLVPSSEGDFILVNHEGANAGDQIVIPRIPHFSSGEEFSIYFRNYFDCDTPSSGEVWIIRPARVQADDVTGGWKLTDKGRLDVR